MAKKRKVTKGKYKCSRCDRTFSMAGHLARHTNAIHKAKRRKKASRKKVSARKKAQRGRRGKKRGRPTGIVSRFGLRNLSLESLSELIAAAKVEARRKLTEVQNALKKG